MTGFSGNPQQVYAENVGTTKVVGPVVLQRDPTVNDIYYPIGQFWINQNGQRLFYLNKQSQVSGVLQSTWELISVSTELVSLSDTANTPVFPSGNSATPPDNIQLVAGSGITIVSTPASNLLTITNTASVSAIQNINVDSGAGSPLAGNTINLNSGTNFTTGTSSKSIAVTAPIDNTHGVIAVQLAGANAATSTAANFGVAQFDSNSFTVTAGFVTLNSAGTTGAVTKILGDDGGANTVVPSAGIITLDGVTVVNATNAKPVFFKKNAVSVEELDVQLTTTSASGAKNLNKSGLCHFDSTSFTVDSATGFVQLTGGATTAIQTITGNDAVAISGSGSPVNVNIVGTGSITTSGAASSETISLTGLTNHNVLIGAGTATITKVAPSATSGIPLISQGAAADPAFGTAVVAGGGTGDTSFTAYAVITGGTTSTGALQNVSGVGTSGQVLTSNGAGLLPTWQASSSSGAVTQFTLDVATTPISPSAGNITLTCGQVATGVVGANVMRTRGNTASSCTIEIQRSTVSAASDSTKNGVCHFSNFNAASNQGYFCTAALTGTLPATPAQGDVVRIVADTASTVTITANTGQKIRIGNVISALAGTAASTKQGDSLDLVYRSSSATWYEVGGAQGSWSIT